MMLIFRMLTGVLRVFPSKWLFGASIVKNLTNKGVDMGKLFVLGAFLYTIGSFNNQQR